MADQPAIGIVAIGASAGGLVALEEFMSHVPDDSGLAYIIVQHLSPTGKTLLSELLQRVTSLGVNEAQQNAMIKPNCAYVIPPNTEIRVVKDRLRLAKPAEPRGLRLPVNVLFSSLASARGRDAIAVVLSGMGSDGTPGSPGNQGRRRPDRRADTGIGPVRFDAKKAAIAAGCADILDKPEALPPANTGLSWKDPGFGLDSTRIRSGRHQTSVPSNPLLRCCISRPGMTFRNIAPAP